MTFPQKPSSRKQLLALILALNQVSCVSYKSSPKTENSNKKSTISNEYF